MFWDKKQEGRIFISYRRADAQCVAGRLSDTLEAYFGGNRIFRDIEDIAGGSDFGQVIEHSLASADAMIVLIGPNWLSITGDKGKPRLHEPDDWVAQEIAAALKLGMPIFPVLIENTPMPRAEELPESLIPLLRYNALTITDKRWQFDVHRLGKILLFDIPSANERKLDLVRLGVSVALCATLVFTAGIIVRNYLCQLCAKAAGGAQLCGLWEPGLPCNEALIKPWQSGLPFIAAVSGSLVLLSIAGLVSEARRRYLYASVGVGSLGSLFFYSILIVLGPGEEPMVSFFGATLVVTLMFVFMNLSGFESK